LSLIRERRPLSVARIIQATVFSTTGELPAITTLEMPVIPSDERPAVPGEQPENRRGGLGQAIRNPLYRSGYALVANTVGSTIVGVAYWAVAARLYDKADVGRTSALVSALILLSSLSQLNMANALPRFLPRSGRRARRLIGYSYGISGLAAFAGAVGFVLILPRLSGQWSFLGHSTALSVMFVAAAVIWGVFALEDAALTGLHKATVVPVENTAYGVLKLGMLVGVAALLPATGIFVSWVVPLVVVIPVINWLIFRRFTRINKFATEPGSVSSREVVRFASIDYAGAVLSQAYGNLLPVIVLTALGAAANGSFYIVWTITSGLSLVAMNFGTSLLVEASAAPHRLAELARGVLTRTLLVTVAGAIGIIVLADPVLRIYGGGYAHAAGLLALLAVATVPRALVVLTWSLDRVAGRVGRAAVTQLALAVLVLGGSWLLVGHLGTTGVGLAWTGGNVLIAIVRLPTLIDAMRRRRGTRPDGVAESPLLQQAGHAGNGKPVMQLRHKGRHRQPGRHRALAR
jgi:O-antigen/teichoic acid export membrane protein